jgi:hypothetical protein
VAANDRLVQDTRPFERSGGSTQSPFGSAQLVLVSNTFAPNWSVGVEYDHRHAHRQSNRAGRCPSKASAIRQDVDIGLVRLN